jgi:hypothetical protein
MDKAGKACQGQIYPLGQRKRKKISGHFLALTRKPNKLEPLFPPSLSNQRKIKAYLLGMLLENVERLARDKRSSLFGLFINGEKEVFKTLTPGPNVIKLFLTVIYDFS